MGDDYDQTLLILKECFVYKIGPRPNAAGYKYDLIDFIWYFILFVLFNKRVALKNHTIMHNIILIVSLFDHYNIIKYTIIPPNTLEISLVILRDEQFVVEIC